MQSPANRKQHGCVKVGDGPAKGEIFLKGKHLGSIKPMPVEPCTMYGRRHQKRMLTDRIFQSPAATDVAAAASSTWFGCRCGSRWLAWKTRASLAGPRFSILTALMLGGSWSAREGAKGVARNVWRAACGGGGGSGGTGCRRTGRADCAPCAAMRSQPMRELFVHQTPRAACARVERGWLFLRSVCGFVLFSTQMYSAAISTFVCA